MAYPNSRHFTWFKAGYVVLLHGALAFVCLKTNFPALSAKTLGLQPAEERSVGLYQSLLPWAERAFTMAPGSTAVVGDSMVKDLDARGIGEGAAILGAGGATVAVLREALELLAPLESAGTVVICAGVNDLKYRTSAEVASDLVALVNEFPAGPRVVCLSVLPLDESVPPRNDRGFIDNAEIAALNRLVASALEDSARARFLDVSRIVRTADGEAIPGAYQSDGWHLSESGRSALEAEIRSHL